MTLSSTASFSAHLLPLMFYLFTHRQDQQIQPKVTGFFYFQEAREWPGSMPRLSMLLERPPDRRKWTGFSSRGAKLINCSW